MRADRKQLGDIAAVVYRRIYARCVAKGVWCPSFEITLKVAARAIETYVHLARLSAEDLAAHRLGHEAAEWHQLARNFLADWLVIDRDRVHLVEIGPDGIDADVWRLISD